ncbi:unnamed protein product [Rhizophagus irregularis]|nr:unnamed protein product [Rhizophagus irregularis]
MEKHQTDENRIMSNRKRKKKRVLPDVNEINDDITPQTNQFMEGIETLPSINKKSINRSLVNLDTETLIDISINPSNHDNTTSSSYMDSMWLLNQDIEMAENESMDVPLCNTTNYNRPDNHVTDHDTDDIVLAMDKCNINTSNYDKLIKDDDFFRPKHSFLPDIIKQNNDLLQLTNNTHQDGQDIKWVGPKNTKNPSLILKQMQNKESMHARPKDYYESYDAFIKLDDIDSYHNVNDKQAFIEINLNQIRGFIGTEVDKLNRRIIIKNRTYYGMRYTVRLFNQKFRNTYMKLHPVTYFNLDGHRVSSKEFKILNVPKDIPKEEIEKAIFKIVQEYFFHIKHSGIKTRDENKATNTVFFTVNNDNSRQILKNTWSIMIRQHLYIIAPAAASAKDLMDRKYYHEEFYGFNPAHSMEKVMEVLTLHKPMHVFRQTDEKVIVEFKAAGDLYNACTHPIHFADFQIQGTSRGTDWITQDDKLKKSHSKRPLHNIPSSHRSNDDIDMSPPVITNTQSDSTNGL